MVFLSQPALWCHDHLGSDVVLPFTRETVGSIVNNMAGESQPHGPPGYCSLDPGVVCLLIVLQWGGTVYAWSDGKVIGVLVVFAVAMLAFICIQSWKQDKGTIPPRIIRHRSVACSTCYVFLAGGAVNIFEYYVCSRGWTSGSPLTPPPPQRPRRAHPFQQPIC